MKKFRFKVVVSILLVVSMIVMVNSAYASTAKGSMKVVSEDKVLSDIVKLITSASDFGLNNAKLTDSFKGLAYDSAYNVYAAGFEYVNTDGTGWNLTAVYDKENNRLVNLMKIDIGSEATQVQLLNGKKTVISKEETKRMMDTECSNCTSKKSYTYNEPSFMTSLFLDKTAHAFEFDWSEESQCSWASIVMCTVWGIIAGFWTGLICDVVMQYVCDNVPLADGPPTGIGVG